GVSSAVSRAISRAGCALAPSGGSLRSVTGRRRAGCVRFRARPCIRIPLAGRFAGGRLWGLHNGRYGRISAGIYTHMSDPRVERRLAAVLAADVAGYSRLMGADEEGTLAALRAI